MYLDHHLLFATNEGIYSLNLDDLQNIEMFQVRYYYSCLYLILNTDFEQSNST